MGKKIALACEICHGRNYNTEKNQLISDRIEIKKFCKHCNRHTIHRETK
ncbi:LSU ribosomal protein L33p [Gracilibacillus boraciitolerans JCM 21714]|uniref:Large ribosomal subunit protein bL33 n=1 Tax=Gracilibacillus boraciitolerans JCM 21714 TaxID=1298598 RepID=W4VLS0_9BACI|nr:50S ribosomal protein L33 [Gracilibacillus boraciitolerans]GAE93773.1 LSU ribosomal protein L33p [Gracilibacillus boraciitolerans JCM 21714]